MTQQVWWCLCRPVGCDVIDEAAIDERFRSMAPELNERERRLWAASEARAAGRGAITATARATGMEVDTSLPDAAASGLAKPRVGALR